MILALDISYQLQKQDFWELFLYYVQFIREAVA